MSMPTETQAEGLDPCTDLTVKATSVPKRDVKLKDVLHAVMKNVGKRCGSGEKRTGGIELDQGKDGHFWRLQYVFES
jgi:hypothetical protein